MLQPDIMNLSIQCSNMSTCSGSSIRMLEECLAARVSLALVGDVCHQYEDRWCRTDRAYLHAQSTTNQGVHHAAIHNCGPSILG